MKKERIVVLCLCVMLSGALHTQWIAWAWQHALHSPATALEPIRTGRRPGTAPNTLQFSAPSNFATVLACAAWPPLSILYSEAIIAGKRSEALPGKERPSGQNQSVAAQYGGAVK